jgi:hypothetical protein
VVDHLVSFASFGRHCTYPFCSYIQCSGCCVRLWVLGPAAACALLNGYQAPRPSPAPCPILDMPPRRSLPAIRRPLPCPLPLLACPQKKQSLKIAVKDDDLVSASTEGVAVLTLDGQGGCWSGQVGKWVGGWVGGWVRGARPCPRHHCCALPSSTPAATLRSRSRSLAGSHESAPASNCGALAELRWAVCLMHPLQSL